MADIRRDPQIGQLIPQAPVIAIRIVLDGCDQSAPTKVAISVAPDQKDCAATFFPGYTASELYAVIDTTIAVLPLRLYFTITNANGVTKQFWVGVRDSRSGVPSGAVIPARPQGSV